MKPSKGELTKDVMNNHKTWFGETYQLEKKALTSYGAYMDSFKCVYLIFISNFQPENGKSTFSSLPLKNSSCFSEIANLSLPRRPASLTACASYPRKGSWRCKFTFRCVRAWLIKSTASKGMSPLTMLPRKEPPVLKQYSLNHLHDFRLLVYIQLFHLGNLINADESPWLLTVLKDNKQRYLWRKKIHKMETSHL